MPAATGREPSQRCVFAPGCPCAWPGTISSALRSGFGSWACSSWTISCACLRCGVGSCACSSRGHESRVDSPGIDRRTCSRPAAKLCLRSRAWVWMTASTCGFVSMRPNQIAGPDCHADPAVRRSQQWEPRWNRTFG